jgi:heme-degrading monooxygenase HmoA
LQNEILDGFAEPRAARRPAGPLATPGLKTDRVPAGPSQLCDNVQIFSNSSEVVHAAHSNRQTPVTQITVIESEPEKQAEALSLMTERARFMSRQPGFVSISLHRSLDGRRIINYIQWQNRDLLRSAHESPEFRKEWGHFDQLTDEIDPHLYEVVHAIDGDQ